LDLWGDKVDNNVEFFYFSGTGNTIPLSCGKYQRITVKLVGSYHVEI
jgi:hypothetical protein